MVKPPVHGRVNMTVREYENAVRALLEKQSKRDTAVALGHAYILLLICAACTVLSIFFGSLTLMMAQSSAPSPDEREWIFWRGIGFLILFSIVPPVAVASVTCLFRAPPLELASK